MAVSARAFTSIGKQHTATVGLLRQPAATLLAAAAPNSEVDGLRAAAAKAREEADRLSEVRCCCYENVIITSLRNMCTIYFYR